MLVENGTTTIKVLWKIIFKEHEVLYNHLFDMTLKSHSQASCYLTQPVTAFSLPHCRFALPLSLPCDSEPNSGKRHFRQPCNYTYTQVTFESMHFHGLRATCDCIVIADQTARESWFWISHCVTVLRGFNSRRRFWHTYLVERIHVHPHAHSHKNKYTATLDEKTGAGC